MKKLSTLLPIALLIAIGCSPKSETADTSATSTPVVSDSSTASVGDTTDDSLTFVSLKVPNMV